LTDVLHSTLLLAADLGVDLGDALEQKLAKDALKYPWRRRRAEPPSTTSFNESAVSNQWSAVSSLGQQPAAPGC
jgi:hypothetical protein